MRARKTCLAAAALALINLRLFTPQALAHAPSLHNPALPRVEERAKPDGGPVRLVENGEPRFAIVGDLSKLMHRSAAGAARQIIEEAFLKTTGKRVECLDAVQDRAAWEKLPAVMLLGDSAAARAVGFDADRLPDQGFLVATFPKGVAIVGNDKRVVGRPAEGQLEKRGTPMSTLFGAVDFCERILGVRYYFPGELGYVYPECRELAVAPVHYESSPYFNTRGNPYGFYCTERDGVKGEKWSTFLGEAPTGPGIQERWRLGRTMELLGKHNPDPRSVAKAHPDKLKAIFYTSPNGRFWYDEKNYFANYYDVVNLEKGRFADILIEDWKRFYASNGKDDPLGIGGLTGQEWINFGVTDVYLKPEDYIADPVVQKLGLVRREDYARGDDRAIMANVYGRFYKYLADRLQAELPGRRLFLLAYYNCKYAPTRYTLPANVDAIVCDGSLLSYVKDPDAAAKARNLFKGWFEALGNRPPGMAYLYACGDPLGSGLTCEYIGDCVRLLGPYLGRTGIFYDGGRSWFRYWAFYAGAHQQWDPGFDAVAAFDEMAEIMFGGPAAMHAKAFHLKLRANCEKYLMPTLMHPQTTPPCPESEIAAMESLLAEARAAIEPGSVAMKRFDVFAHDWPEAFAKMRAKLSKTADGTGVYPVERRSGAKQDWSGIPAVPGSNGLRLVWDDEGLHGMAEGEIHYELRSFGKGAAPVKLDYDTAVPGFSLAFGPAFSGRVYKAIELKPFGRLRLLGAGDQAAPAGAERRTAFGDMSGAVKLSAASQGDAFTVSGPKATYTPAFNLIGENGETLRKCQAAMAGTGAHGLFSWSAWFNVTVNGIAFGEVDFGADNLSAWVDGERRGFEYALNFDGARVKLRFYMQPESSFLWGELEAAADSPRPVTNATLHLASIPSFLIRAPEKAPMPYKRQLRTARGVTGLPEASRHATMTLPLSAGDRWYILEDANYDGSSEDKGFGPTMALVDWRQVESGAVQLGKDRRDIRLDFTLGMPLTRIRFGVWEDRGRRHSNDEILRLFQERQDVF